MQEQLPATAPIGRYRHPCLPRHSCILHIAERGVATGAGRYPVGVIRFYTAANLAEAHLLLRLLADAGIAAHVFNEHAQGAAGQLPLTQIWPEIWLESESDLVRADTVRRRFEHAGDAPPRRCAQCDEQNPGSFEICWQCGASLS